jgi:molecular chaperone DnaK (HSP70)
MIIDVCCSNVLVYRLGGSTYECSIIRTIGGCFQTIVSIDGFENSGDAFTDLVTDIIADEFQKYLFFIKEVFLVEYCFIFI